MSRAGVTRPELSRAHLEALVVAIAAMDEAREPLHSHDLESR